MEPAAHLFAIPAGKPVVLSPLATCVGLYDEPFTKLVRTVSGASTQVPDLLELDGCDDLAHSPAGNSSTHDDDEEEEVLLEAPSRATRQVFCAGLPELRSELGRWAQAVVNAELWLEAALREQETRKKSGPVREYLVDTCDLKADTVGLALRRSKSVLDREWEVCGPLWGSTIAGVDHGDGWVQVNQHFLPIELDDMVVLTPLDEVMRDGPALTMEGCALDLEGGEAIFFSHDRTLAEGCHAKRQLKRDAQALRASRRACAAREAAARIEAGEVCAVDVAGTVLGALPKCQDVGLCAAARWKLFRQKRQARLGSARGRRLELFRERFPLCAGPDGRFFLLLALGSSAERAERLRLARAVRRSESAEDQGAPCGAWVVDAHGVMHV